MRNRLDFLSILLYYLAKDANRSPREVTFMLLFRINTIINNKKPSYGLDVFNQKELLRRYTNISDNQTEITKLIGLCNSLDIEECHIDDIIEDFLTDFKTY